MKMISSTMRPCTVTLVILMGLTACKVQDPSANTTTTQPIPVNTQTISVQQTALDQTNLVNGGLAVVNNQSVLKTLLGEGSTVPAIDFTKYSVILDNFGDYSSSGAGTVISSVMESDNTIDVTVNNNIAGSGCIGASSFFRFFHAIIIPKTNKPVLFKQYESTYSCGNTPNTPQNVTVKDIPFSILPLTFKNNFTVTDHRLEAILNTETLNRFYKLTNPNLIDFNQYTLIGVHAGTKSTSQIAVESIKNYGTYAIVTVVHTVPGNICNVMQPPIAPSQFVTVPRTTPRIIFQEKMVVFECK